jgi:hypothetical protein
MWEGTTSGVMVTDRPYDEFHYFYSASPKYFGYTLLHYRKVAGSIPSGVIGLFHWRNPSGRTMALASTQPLTKMITRNISGA